MMDYKTKKKITLVLACSTLVTALSSCQITSVDNQNKNEEVDYDKEICQILDDNLKKFEEMNSANKKDNNKEENSNINVTNVIDEYVFGSSDTQKYTNLSVVIYGEAITPIYFNDSLFLNFLCNNNIKLGEKVSDELFEQTYNLSLSTFTMNYAAGLYTSGNYIITDDIENMELIMKYNKYISDLNINNMLYSNTELTNEINEYYDINNINLKWNEVPFKTNTYQRSYSN